MLLLVMKYTRIAYHSFIAVRQYKIKKHSNPCSICCYRHVQHESWKHFKKPIPLSLYGRSIKKRRNKQCYGSRTPKLHRFPMTLPLSAIAECAPILSLYSPCQVLQWPFLPLHLSPPFRLCPPIFLSSSPPMLVYSSPDIRGILLCASTCLSWMVPIICDNIRWLCTTISAGAALMFRIVASAWLTMRGHPSSMGPETWQC